MIGIEPHVKLRLKIHVLVNLPVMIKLKLVFPGFRLQTGIDALAVNFVVIIVAPDRQVKGGRAFVYAERRINLQADKVGFVIALMAVQSKTVADQTTGLHQVGGKPAGIGPALIISTA